MEGGSVVIVNRRDNFRGNYLGRKRGTVNYYDGGGGELPLPAPPPRRVPWRRNKETRGGRKKKGRKQGNKVKRHEREASWQGRRVGCAPVGAQEKKKRHGEEELRIRHLNATVMFTKCRKYKQTRAFYALRGTVVYINSSNHRISRVPFSGLRTQSLVRVPIFDGRVSANLPTKWNRIWGSRWFHRVATSPDVREREREGKRDERGRRSNRLDFNAFSVLLLSKPFDIIVSERGRRTSRLFFEGKCRVGFPREWLLSEHFVSVVAMPKCWCFYACKERRAWKRVSLKYRKGRKECKLYINLSIVAPITYVESL